jgi:predicted DNA-binding transcriptional regulator YafY
MDAHMGKTARILQLVNLLVSRECVTLDNIRSTCHIPTRTVYRYLNWISEAEIPVYFDRDVQAYRLTRSRRISMDDFTLHDAVLLVTCLKTMSSHVNEEYRADLDRLVTKVLVRQEVSLEGEFVHALGLASGAQHEPDYSETVATALVTAAVAAGRSVQLSTMGEDGQSKTEEISEPRLTFAGSWGISNGDPSDDRESKLDSVSKVTIL